ncbi:MAG: hypothetical protein JKY65_26605 [Planctomycetes bacterium]|nr:hypothetical protein [Planctomycetota bacterium]
MGLTTNNAKRAADAVIQSARLLGKDSAGHLSDLIQEAEDGDDPPCSQNQLAEAIWGADLVDRVWGNGRSTEGDLLSLSLAPNRALTAEERRAELLDKALRQMGLERPGFDARPLDPPAQKAGVLIRLLIEDALRSPEIADRVAGQLVFAALDRGEDVWVARGVGMRILDTLEATGVDTTKALQALADSEALNRDAKATRQDPGIAHWSGPHSSPALRLARAAKSSADRVRRVDALESAQLEEPQQPGMASLSEIVRSVSERQDELARSQVALLQTVDQGSAKPGRRYSEDHFDQFCGIVLDTANLDESDNEMAEKVGMPRSTYLSWGNPETCPSYVPQRVRTALRGRATAQAVDRRRLQDDRQWRRGRDGELRAQVNGQND